MRLPEPLKNLLVTVGILLVGASLYGAGPPLAQRSEEVMAFVGAHRVRHKDLSVHVARWSPKLTWEKAVRAVAGPLRGLVERRADTNGVTRPLRGYKETGAAVTEAVNGDETASPSDFR